MSNRRKATKAAACHASSRGTIASTARKATISSHTIAPWSPTPRCRPVTPQAQTPARNSAPASASSACGGRYAPSAQPSAHAASVPAVPGANGASPAPKPNATTCAGWEKAKPARGRSTIIAASCAGEMIEAAAVRDRLARRVEHLQHRGARRGAGLDGADPRQRDLQLARQRLELPALRLRGGEQQLVVVAAGKDAVTLQLAALLESGRARNRRVLDHRADLR